MGVSCMFARSCAGTITARVVSAHCHHKDNSGWGVDQLKKCMFPSSNEAIKCTTYRLIPGGTGQVYTNTLFFVIIYRKIQQHRQPEKKY
jgi:hypothetical protein